MTNPVPKNLKSRSHRASIMLGIIGARVDASRIEPSDPSVYWSGLNTLWLICSLNTNLTPWSARSRLRSLAGSVICKVEVVWLVYWTLPWRKKLRVVLLCLLELRKRISKLWLSRLDGRDHEEKPYSLDAKSSLAVRHFSNGLKLWLWKFNFTVDYTYCTVLLY